MSGGVTGGLLCGTFHSANITVKRSGTTYHKRQALNTNASFAYCSFLNCESDDNGGALCFVGSGVLVLTESEFVNCLATKSPSGMGGGVFVAKAQGSYSNSFQQPYLSSPLSPSSSPSSSSSSSNTAPKPSTSLRRHLFSENQKSFHLNHKSESDPSAFETHPAASIRLPDLDESFVRHCPYLFTSNCTFRHCCASAAGGGCVFNGPGELLMTSFVRCSAARGGGVAVLSVEPKSVAQMQLLSSLPSVSSLLLESDVLLTFHMDTEKGGGEDKNKGIHHPISSTSSSKASSSSSSSFFFSSTSSSSTAHSSFHNDPFHQPFTRTTANPDVSLPTSPSSYEKTIDPYALTSHRGSILPFISFVSFTKCTAEIGGGGLWIGHVPEEAGLECRECQWSHCEAGEGAGGGILFEDVVVPASHMEMEGSNWEGEEERVCDALKEEGNLKDNFISDDRDAIREHQMNRDPFPSGAKSSKIKGTVQNPPDKRATEQSKSSFYSLFSTSNEGTSEQSEQHSFTQQQDKHSHRNANKGKVFVVLSKFQHCSGGAFGGNDVGIGTGWSGQLEKKQFAGTKSLSESPRVTDTVQSAVQDELIEVLTVLNSEFIVVFLMAALVAVALVAVVVLICCCVCVIPRREKKERMARRQRREAEREQEKENGKEDEDEDGKERMAGLEGNGSGVKKGSKACSDKGEDAPEMVQSPHPACVRPEYERSDQISDPKNTSLRLHD
eukprot:MONOS_8766.1-p1 / transcript=MONOS_8766.1 / gene=MONOS_8766 / organism=Monocercomonoides_exilis_PA203 / gene_product=unspecified product / transcript_product=unspecified product / location=Mono_scaffold00339:43662-45836(+) / protein_length=725 / sequence_SO=supercontig / SO=protein_coding / is_pseudo=false